MKIVYQGLLGLFIDPTSSYSTSLEASFLAQNQIGDQWKRISSKGEFLYKVTLISSQKMKLAINQISEKMNCSKGFARKFLEQKISKYFETVSIPSVYFFTELEEKFDTIETKEGTVERRSLVAFVYNDDQWVPFLQKISKDLDLELDSNRALHMSVYNLTGNSSDSPSLL